MPSLSIAVPGFFEALFGGVPKAGRLPGFVALLGSDEDPDDQVSSDLFDDLGMGRFWKAHDFQVTSTCSFSKSRFEDCLTSFNKSSRR